MAKEFLSRLDDIEVRIQNRDPINKFDVFWMAQRLRKYEEQLTLAVLAIEELIPGTGELDPLEAGTLVQRYLEVLDAIIKIEQKRSILNRRTNC